MDLVWDGADYQMVIVGAVKYCSLRPFQEFFFIWWLTPWWGLFAWVQGSFRVFFFEKHVFFRVFFTWKTPSFFLFFFIIHYWLNFICFHDWNCRGTVDINFRELQMEINILYIENMNIHLNINTETPSWQGIYLIFLSPTNWKGQ